MGIHAGTLRQMYTDWNFAWVSGRIIKGKMKIFFDVDAMDGSFWHLSSVLKCLCRHIVYFCHLDLEWSSCGDRWQHLGGADGRVCEAREGISEGEWTTSSAWISKLCMYLDNTSRHRMMYPCKPNQYSGWLVGGGKDKGKNRWGYGCIY